MAALSIDTYYSLSHIKVEAEVEAMLWVILASLNGYLWFICCSNLRSKLYFVL